MQRIYKWVVFGFLSQANLRYMRLPAHIVIITIETGEKMFAKSLCGKKISQSLFTSNNFKKKCKNCVKKESLIDGKEISQDYAHLQVKSAY